MNTMIRTGWDKGIAWGTMFCKRLMATLPALKDTFVIFERGILLFPLLVVLIVTAMFPFGGHVAPWQAPAALAVTVGYMLFQRQYTLKRRIGALLLLATFLAISWCVLGCLLISGWDSTAYHYPKVFLLMKGWNPFTLNTLESLSTFSGLSLYEMNSKHVLLLSHTVHVFNAAIGFFVQAPHSPNFGLIPFLLISTGSSFWRMLRTLKWSRAACLATITLLLGGIAFTTFPIYNSVDGAVYLASLGMLACMIRTLYHNRCTMPLLIFSCWMMTVKQSALMSCFIFWVLFSLILLWKNRKDLLKTLGWLAMCGGILIFLLLWICSSPYLSSWKTYGHPLYPAYSGDAQRFPTYDITSDFHQRNADAKQMGHLGHFVNAYVSSKWACKYYAWKTDNDAFRPSCVVWKSRQKKSNPASPVPSYARHAYLIAFLTLLLFGKRGERLLALFILISLIAVPTAYLGYRRYVPWIEALPFLSAGYVIVLLQRWFPQYSKWIAIHGAAMLTFFGLYHGGYRLCEFIDKANTLDYVLWKPGIEAIIYPSDMAWYNRTVSNGGTLLRCAFDSRLRHVKSITYDPALLKKTYRSHDWYFPLLLKPGLRPRVLFHQHLPDNAPLEEKITHHMRFLPYTLAVTFPKVLKSRIARFSWDLSLPRGEGK